MKEDGALEVEFRDVSYATTGKEILRSISFHVGPGETMVLLGRSGSGKTTALRLINGMLRATGGEVLVGKRPLDAWDLIELRRRTGYVIQESGLFPHFSVARNVGLVPRLLGWEEARIASRVEELLAQVGLPAPEYGPRYPRELSGGQRQRIGVARALAAHPGLLLLDEPFGALDPVTRLELQRHFLELRAREGVTAIFVTHDVREAMVLGTKIALLEQGRLDFLGTPDEFFAAKTPEAERFLEVLK